MWTGFARYIKNEFDSIPEEVLPIFNALMRVVNPRSHDLKQEGAPKPETDYPYAPSIYRVLLGSAATDIMEHLDETNKELLEEARKLVGQYSFKVHPPHDLNAGGQKHFHVYIKGNQIFSINLGGTAHDRSHGTHIPKKVAKALARKYPDLQLPDNLILENAEPIVNETISQYIKGYRIYELLLEENVYLGFPAIWFR